MGSKVKWVKLGDYITARNERNSDLRYGIDLIEGVNSRGEFQQTKAITAGIDLKPYKAVWPGDIAYNPSRLNIGSLAYRESGMCIVSHLYQVFHVKDKYKDVLLPEFLLVWFKRDEFLRSVDYFNYGSQRAEFNLKKLGELDIPLPSIEEQRKVVNVWKVLREVKAQNEAKAAPLLQLCQSYIQELKHKYPKNYRIGKAIKVYDKTNINEENLEVLGLNSNKEFMPTVANLESVSTKKYKVVSKGVFAFSGMQTGRDECIRICLYDKDTSALISPAYTTFTLDDTQPLLPEYLMLSFKSSEMDRLGWFYSDSSVRSNLDWNRFLEIEISLPPIDVQQAIVDIYKCANEAKQIAAEADRMSREVCPALIQHIINA